MRVVSGKYKGKRFSPPRKFPSRPTTDMAKEALFAIFDARVYFDKLDILDLFSGTGNISLEFLSRGVGAVVSVDSHAISWKFQQKIAAELDEPNWNIIRQDAFDYVQNCQKKFDIIFADPPFDYEKLKDIPTVIFENELLVDDGIFVMEHSDRVNFKGAKYLKQTRKYGGVCFSFFEY